MKTRLLWLVHHPRTVLRTLLELTRSRSWEVPLETLSLFIAESLEGIATEIPGVDSTGYQGSDSAGYAPTLYYKLPRLLHYVTSDDTFVDLGCGKGRVLWFIATRRKLRKVIGIEIHPELARIARENMAKAKLRTPVIVIEADVTQVDLSEGTVYFLYNPFGEETLRRVLERIRKSLEARPRNIRIVYENPRLAHIFDETVWLRAEKANGFFRVWRSQCPAELA